MSYRKKIHFDPSSDEPRSDGCPVCAFMREYQARYLRTLDSDGIRALCAYHVWQVASIVNAVTAAKIFLRLLDDAIPASRECDLCVRIKIQEDSKVRDFCSTFSEHHIQAALSRCRGLCLRHAAAVSSHFPPALGTRIGPVLQNHATDLKRGLSRLLSDSNAGQARHAGILGRAAEFLVAQRGLKNH
jgi:hypothetical protein